MLEGQNSVLSEIVHDIIQGRYGGLSQTSLEDSLSESLSASMVEQARLFNLLVDHVNQDQFKTFNSILPPSQLPIDLRKEERTSQSNKRVLSEIDVSEWEVTYKETHLRDSKRSCNTDKIGQLIEVETRSQAEILGRQTGKKRRIVKKDQQQVSKPKELPPAFATTVDNPGISYVIARTPSSRIRTSGQLKVITSRSRSFKGSQTSLTSWVISLSENTSLFHFVLSNLGSRFFLRGVGCDAPGF
jgi:hypothetical protein